MNPMQTLMALAELAHDPQHPVPSPCTSVCRINPEDGLCQGCLRDIDEVIEWGRMDEAAKRIVWRAIVGRASARSAG